MNRLTYSKTFWVAVIGGGLTGMGNGSVFGAALMCALGRGPFDDWGGIGLDAYNVVTFQGFMNWCMIVFGVAFTIIVMLALKRHGELEKSAH
ncbi:MAG: hypothetical protein LBV36_06815 [Chromatiales bacterium]|jgi:hypothetical protein|nr:hypothetical protein [Chromatiales bacterium]